MTEVTDTAPPAEGPRPARAAGTEGTSPDRDDTASPALEPSRPFDPRLPAALRRCRPAAADPAHLHVRVADAGRDPRRDHVWAGAVQPDRAALFDEPPGRVHPRPGRAAGAEQLAAHERGRVEPVAAARRATRGHQLPRHVVRGRRPLRVPGAPAAARRQGPQRGRPGAHDRRRRRREGDGVRHPAAGSRGVLRVLRPRGGQPHAVQRRPLAVARQRDHHAARRAARDLRRQAGGETGRRGGPSRQGDRRWPPRHPPPAQRRS